MRSLILIFLVLLPTSAFADAACVSIEDATVINRCGVCMVVTLQQLRPPGDTSSPLLRGLPQQKQLAAGERATIAPGHFAITDFHKC